MNHAATRPWLSIVLPVLDEAGTLAHTLRPLQAWRARGCELIVVDGGSRDATVAEARPLCDTVVETPRGRAVQMNAGAAVARGEVLLFLHADTRLPGDADTAIRDALRTSGRCWGRFDVIIEGRSRMLPVVAALMNARSRLTGIATGDQALFCTRDAFRRAGEFPAIALMEDIALSKSLRRLSRPACLRLRAVTSGRRWDEHGAWPTILLMWRLRAAYFLGADPAALARRYRDARAGAAARR